MTPYRSRLDWLPRYYLFRRYYLPRAGELVLDAGCGDGSLTRRLAAEGVDVVGTDLIAAVLPRRHGRYVAADAGRLPLADAVFDLVVSLDVLSYVPDPDQVLAEFCRVLKPGGRAVISVPCGYTRSGRLYRAQRLLRRILPRCLLAKDDAGRGWFDFSDEATRQRTGNLFSPEELSGKAEQLFEVTDLRFGLNVFTALATDLANALKKGEILKPFLFFWAVRLDRLLSSQDRGYLMFLALRKK